MCRETDDASEHSVQDRKTPELPPPTDPPRPPSNSLAPPPRRKSSASLHSKQSNDLNQRTIGKNSSNLSSDYDYSYYYSYSKSNDQNENKPA